MDIHQQQFNSNDTTTNLSIFNNKYNNKLMIQRHHHSVTSLKGDDAITTTDEDDKYGSSDDESYNKDDDLPSSYYNDNLSRVVNVTNLNLREYGPPRCDTYNVHSMITAMNLIQQQELVTVWSLTKKRIWLQMYIFQKCTFSDKIL